LNLKPYLFCFHLLALSRLGHRSYDVVGTQIIQTGVPASKADLIGAMEISIGSLAKLVMLAMVIIANGVYHFGFLGSHVRVISFRGSMMFCRWLSNPTDKQRELFTFDPLYQVPVMRVWIYCLTITLLG
jgi:hypothetical protein